MNKQQIAVLCISVLISFSGILINFRKKGTRLAIQFTRDNATLHWFRVLVPLALGLSIVIYLSQVGQLLLPVSGQIAGYSLVGLGLGIRWAAIIGLGPAFTVQVSILEDHRLKTDGIYKWLRHPSYTGLLLYYLGLGLAMQNWICLVLLTIGPLVAVINRIKTEEKVLTQHFQRDYTDYQKRSWQLFPFLY